MLCVSSLSVFGCKLDGGLVTEESPLASVRDLSNWDYYGRSKILAEQVAQADLNKKLQNAGKKPVP